MTDIIVEQNILPEIKNELPLAVNTDAPEKQLTDYINAMFEPTDYVDIVSTAYHDIKNDKYKPYGIGNIVQASTLIEALAGHTLNEVFSDYNELAGAWVRINPVVEHPKGADGRGKGVANTDIAALEYVLVESDELSKEEQFSLIQRLRLPCAAVVDSGGKSIHAAVLVEVKNLTEYKQRVAYIYSVCNAFGLKVDPNNKNPARLTRTPGFMRNGRRQSLLATNIGFRSFEEWYDWRSTQVNLPEQPAQKHTPQELTERERWYEAQRELPGMKNLQDEALDALNATDPDCVSEYGVWLPILSSCKGCGLTMEQVDAWSKRGSKYVPGEVESRWHGLQPFSPGILFKEAMRQGWQSPNKERAAELRKQVLPTEDDKSADITLPLFDRIAKQKPAVNPRVLSLDDVQYPLLFALCHPDLRFCTEKKSWCWYEYNRWHIDSEGLGAEKKMFQFSKVLLQYLASGDTGADSQQQSRLLNTAAKWLDRGKRQKALADARTLHPISASAFDADPYLLNTPNGILDLHKPAQGEWFSFLPSDPDKYMTKVTGAVYDPSARCPLFIKTLYEVLQGNREKAAYLQMVFGYCLLGCNPLERFYIIYGMTTRNGKSSIIDTFAKVLGDYAANADPKTLAVQKNASGSSASSDVARLAGCRLITVQELPQQMMLDSAKLKSWTGGDAVTARNLYQGEIEFKVGGKIIINTNYLPFTHDTSIFDSDRVEVVTFDRHFTAEERDVMLKERLCESSELSGILNWALCGLLKYYKSGRKIPIPDCVRAATADYRASCDKVVSFLEDVCVPCKPESGGMVELKQMYAVYQSWCMRTGQQVDGRNSFADNLRRKGMLKNRATIAGKQVRNVVVGYRLPVA